MWELSSCMVLELNFLFFRYLRVWQKCSIKIIKFNSNSEILVTKLQISITPTLVVLSLNNSSVEFFFFLSKNKYEVPKFQNCFNVLQKKEKKGTGESNLLH